MPRFANHQSNSARRGTVYVLMLGISMIVLTLSLGAVAVVRTQAQICRDSADASDAAAYAQSAIEIGRALIASDPNWRTTYTNGDWITNRSIGSGAFTLNVVNPNGTLNNSPTDPVIMTGTGVKNHARHITQVMLQPTPQPMTCLAATLWAQNNVSMTSATLQHVGTVGCNRNVSASSSLIAGDIEAAGFISGGTYTGRRTANAPLRTMPDPATVHSHYVANGTAISINVIPKIGGVATIDRRLFSPSNNPFFGAVNPQGIYYIDCAGAPIIVQNSRIVGTLVLLNVGPNSVMQGAMLAATAVANYPALIVKGDFRIAVSGTLNESGTPNLNFNPPSTPYNGVSNSTTTDNFATQLQGLMYVSGTLTIATDLNMTGVIVAGGAANLSGSINLSHSKIFYANAPPGFYEPAILMPVPGTWKRIVN